MPYIDQDQRAALEPSLKWLLRDVAAEGFTPGQVNYLICRLADAYVTHHGLNYDNASNMQKVLVGALDEYNTHVMRPYEATKIEANGTVWFCMEEPHPDFQQGETNG